MVDAKGLRAAADAYNAFELGSDVDHCRKIIAAYLQAAQPGWRPIDGERKDDAIDRIAAAIDAQYGGGKFLAETVVVHALTLPEIKLLGNPHAAPPPPAEGER